MRVHPLCFLVAAVLLDCAELTPIPASTCGNRVIDVATEDCDGFDTDCGPQRIEGGPARPDACRLRCAAPGTTNACHFECSPTAPCPDGWGCSADKVCRRPSGRFGSPSDPLSTGAVTLSTADFDGDGRGDVLASGPRSALNAARARVHFFSSNGRGNVPLLDSVVSFAAPITSPSSRDLNGDGAADIVYGVSAPEGPGGFAAMLGERARSFTPVVFPSFSLPGGADGVLVVARPGVAVQASDAAPIPFIVGKVLDAAGNVVTAITSFDVTAKGYRHLLPADAAIKSVAWAQLLTDDANHACGEIVVSYVTNGESALSIVSPCQAGPGGGIRLSDTKEVAFPIPFDANLGVHIADANVDGFNPVVRDGISDIIYVNKLGETRVAFGNRNDFLGTSDRDKALSNQLDGLVPLASGDINNDGKLDYVMPKKILLSGANANGFFELLSQRRDGWTTARVASFDADLTPDVVAAGVGEPDLDFFSGAQPSTMVRATIFSNGPIVRIAAGDFDGDRLNDLAFGESRGGATDLQIAYGQSLGPPATPRNAGRIASVGSIEPFPAGVPFGVAVLSSVPAGATDKLPSADVAILRGSGDRQPVAPIFLTSNVNNQTWQPLAVAAGPFVQSGGTIDFLGLALGTTRIKETREIREELALWGAFGAPPRAGDLVSLSGAVKLTANAPSARVSRIRPPFATGDLDGDGVDDVVLVSPADAPVISTTILANSKTGQASVSTDQPLGPSYSTTPDSEVVLVDVDGDGLRDAVALLSIEKKSRVVVFFNLGKGKLELPGVVLPVDGPVGFAPVVTGGVEAFAKDGTRRRPLAVLTKTSLHLVNVGRGPIGPPELVVDKAFTGATGIANADLDGDGLEELVVADDLSLRVLPHLPYDTAGTP